MSEKRPKVVWSNSKLRLVAIPSTKYHSDTIFVFENCQSDTLGFESWRQVERITDASSPVWQFIDSLVSACGTGILTDKFEG